MLKQADKQLANQSKWWLTYYKLKETFAGSISLDKTKTVLPKPGIRLVLPMTQKKDLLQRVIDAINSEYAVQVHPRDVFRDAIKWGAYTVVVAHNHPSGDPTPSPEDVLLTERLVKAGETCGIPLMDHLVIGRAEGDGRGFVSIREEGCVVF